MSEDYQVQNVYRYSRKSYKNNGRRVSVDNDVLTLDDINVETAQCSPRSDDAVIETGCSCDMDPEGDIANILHKKCPVITLAQQQLQRLLDETDNILCDNTRCCRSIYDFLCICQEVLKSRNKSLCFILMLSMIMFSLGVLLGAASCGARFGRFNSPLLQCLDNFFTSDLYDNLKDYHGII